MNLEGNAIQLDRRTRRLLDRQRGVLSRKQTAALGITESALRYRLRAGGPWQEILPRTYLTVTGEPTREQREIAALLYAGPGSVVTGPSALHRHWIRCPEKDSVDVLVAAECLRRSVSFAVLHRTRRMPEVSLVHRGVAITTPARAVLDTVSWLTSLGDARAIVAGAVQQRRCSIADLQDELEHGPRRGTALMRAVLAEVAAGIRSAPEGDLRDLILRFGLPNPMFNPRLYLDGKFLASPDAWWPTAGVAVEVDSVEFHFALADWRHTVSRSRRLTAAGILVLHVTPQQLRENPAQIAAEIAAALARGRAPAGITARTVAA